jgi:prevent-host-death family protein
VRQLRLARLLLRLTACLDASRLASPSSQICLVDHSGQLVTNILVMSDVLPLAEVKAKFSEMVDRVEQQHDRITVTRNGRPAAVLMSADELAALEDTLDLLSDPVAVAGIEQARQDVAAGNTVSADDLRVKYLRP